MKSSDVVEHKLKCYKCGKELDVPTAMRKIMEEWFAKGRTVPIYGSCCNGLTVFDKGVGVRFTPRRRHESRYVFPYG